MQGFRVSGTAGAFTLTFKGATTDPLPFNATAAQVQDALIALSSIGGVGGSVAVIRNPDRGNDFFVSFSGGTLAGQDVPAITGSGSGGASVSRPFTVSNGGPLPGVDQRGFPRVAFGRVDIGAFELNPPNTAPQVACSEPVAFNCVPGAGLAVSMQAAVTDPDSGQTLTVTLKQGELLLDTQTVASPAAGVLVTFNPMTFLPGLHPLTVEVDDGTELGRCETTLTLDADAEEQIRRCIALVDRLDPRKEKQLINALEHALKELAKDKGDRLRKADRKLEEFIRKVQEALKKRHLTPDQAAQLIACATQAQSALGCP
jgi:hypothetical protein